MRRTRILTLLVTTVVLLAACGGSGSKTVSTKDGDVTVSKNGDQVDVKSDKGTASFGAGTKLPTGFPKSEVPVPEDLDLATAIAGNDKFTLSYKLGDTKVDRAISDYRDTLTGAGFTIEDDTHASVGGSQISTLRATGNGWAVSTSSIGAVGDLLVIAVSKNDGSGG